jgi:hypothetical protein
VQIILRRMKGLLPFLLILNSIQSMMMAELVEKDWIRPDFVSDCKCPQSVYDITTRRSFCGKELELYNPKRSAFEFCRDYQAFICPQDGPGKATLLPLPKRPDKRQYCFLACQPPPNQGNVNECNIRFIDDQEKALNSIKKLYPRYKLPKSHLPKKN